jgi:hypothetical protein
MYVYIYSVYMRNFRRRRQFTASMRQQATSLSLTWNRADDLGHWYTEMYGWPSELLSAAAGSLNAYYSGAIIL